MKALPDSKYCDRRWTHRFRIALGLAACLMLLASSERSLAQEFRAILTGDVTDPDGRAVVGATVTAINNDTKSTYTAQTSNAGVYYIPYVVPGTYTVKATAAGFKTAVQDKVELLAGKYFGQDFKLEVGAFHETVEVTAAPPMIETANGSGGTILDEKTVTGMPLDGRQVYMLIGTTPGSQFTQTTFGPGGYSGTRGWDNTNAYIIGGGAPTGNFTGALGGYNQFTLDGTNITQQTTYNNQNAGAWNVAPNVDAIQEVNVMASTYDARYSRTGGGTINIVTKNGTNRFHGDLFEFYEGALFNANFVQNIDRSIPRQGMTQNQFGGTFGGPIIKNKLFFFGSYEGYRESIAGNVLTAVPPAYLLPGYNGNSGVNFGLIQQNDPQDFPNGVAVFDPSTTYCNETGAAPGLAGVDSCASPNDLVRSEFPNDTMPASAMNQYALKLLTLYPLPNVPGRQNSLTNNYFANTPDIYSYNQYMVRVDYNTSDKTKWYSFYEYQPGSENRSTNGLLGLAENGNVDHTRKSWTAAQDMTHMFSPTFLADFKVSFSRFADHSPDGDFGAAVNASTFFGAGFSMPDIPTTTFKDLPEINSVGNAGASGTGGFTNIIGNAITNDATTNVILDADFTKTKGAHSIHFGGVYAEFQYGDPQSVGNANGQFNFGSAATQYNGTNGYCWPVTAIPCTAGTPLPNGLGLADMLLGYPDGGHVDYNYTIMEGQPAWALYAQDDWKVNHRLTLNLGIRYDVQRGLRERHNALNRGVCFTCVNPVSSDPTYQANVASTANQAAWTAAGVNPASLTSVLGGIQYAGINGQSRDGYNTDWSNIAPRVGFAFSLNPKTVIRGGWGYMFGGGLEGGTTYGYTASTGYISSVDFGALPNAPGYGADYNGYSFASGTPYSGVIHPQTTTLGMLTNIGSGWAMDFPGRKIPKTMIMSVGIQRELPQSIVVDARYSGNFASRLRVYNTVNNFATLEEVQQHIAADAAGQTDNWVTQVPNPYYNVPAFANTGCGYEQTVPAIYLLAPLSQYCSGGEYQWNLPVGKTWYNALEVKLTKRAGNGLTFNVAYTYSKTMQATSYNGVGPANGYGDNPYSAGEWPWQFPNPTHEVSDYDRTHMLATTATWELPFGKGKPLLASPPAGLGYVVNNWSLSGIFAYSSGNPVRLPSTSGWNYVSSHSLKPEGGPSYTQWVWNNDGFPLGCSTGTPGCPAQGIPTAWVYDSAVSPWGIGYLRDFYSGVRNPSIPNLDLTLAKNFPITESKRLELRWDVFNVFNNRLYNGPDTTPSDVPTCSPTPNGAPECTGYGNIDTTQQLNFPRRMQVALKFLF
ncbi:conserved exported hypothetical protein [Candidatus Sulfotelmatobacter kueseliae]|uniref:TonB-dependent transporter Oar-like beta-barrel domain-containing protein n=1 Tax=Candidatus Sulfotelmatobacter kueseliae TaxID=2042962 RepID=A0A2U3L2G0_9BACT|nr:conserved exported hypothetical protein [Candidatus Sulfotelmatobacter kueseliae]